MSYTITQQCKWKSNNDEVCTVRLIKTEWKALTDCYVFHGNSWKFFDTSEKGLFAINTFKIKDKDSSILSIKSIA